MKAIIFAAGLGTRLKPITNQKPKALVEINGKPLLWYAIQKMVDIGVEEIVINVHHFAESIERYIYDNKFEIPIHISNEKEQLLDTGGGLFNAQQYLQNTDVIIAYNVDIISTVDLQAVIKQHLQQNNLATLVVRSRATNRYLLFNKQLQLSGWKNISTAEKIITNSTTEKLSQFAFSGIQIISPGIFKLSRMQGKFSIINLYLELSKSHSIAGYIDHSDIWLDVGKPEQLANANSIIR